MKETVTDVTWTSTTASEVVTAAELLLNLVFDAKAVMQSPVASDTAVEVACVVGPVNNQVTVMPNAAAAAGSTLSGSVVRVWARGV